MNEYTAFYLFCGIGGMAIGGQRGRVEYKGKVTRFRTLGGIDCDREACDDFTNLTGVPAACLDLFSESDYVAFHGHQPAPGWREASAEDILAAAGWEYPDMVALSPPCKGFSGLLPAKSAASDRYQALNRLTVRGLSLTLEAFKGDLPAVILLENVPRITSRGEGLIKQLKALLGRQGYLFTEGYHDCGELGGLAQHRKRYLLIARLESKMSSFIYKPPKRRVRAIGEVIGPLPMPDDPAMGQLHRLPRLQWKTWVRLALIPAGGDWRDLENCGQYRIEHIKRGSGSLGVQNWDQPGYTVICNAKVGGSSATAISDPRLSKRDNRHPGIYQVVSFDKPGPCVAGTRFGSGAPAVADIRLNLDKDRTHRVIYRVTPWEETANTVTGAAGPNNGAIVVTDPRVAKQGFSNCFQIHRWDRPAATVTGISDIQSGAQSFADPRLGCKCRNGSYGVQDWSHPANTVIGAGDIHSGATAIADPRIPTDTEVLDPPPMIIALDGTWHRPLTTLELAVLQGFDLIMPNGSPLKLAGKSDQRWRERIGNAVPPPAFEAISEEILLALLVSEKGEWMLSSTDIWVKPVIDDIEYPVIVNSIKTIENNL